MNAVETKENLQITEKVRQGRGGAVALILIVVAVAALALGMWFTISGGSALDAERATGALGLPALASLIIGTLLLAFCWLPLTMIVLVNPGHTKVVQFFGTYIGTVRKTGLSIVPLFSNSSKISIRVNNFETNQIKVNDLDGNPINIAAIVVWQVADTAKAKFAVEDYAEFVKTQSEAALRHIAGLHPYDRIGMQESKVLSLLGSTVEVSAELQSEVAERVTVAGVQILEVRISALSYAPEIAQAMLQRQQATAVLAAREQIVEGAVSMVQSALGRLEKEQIVQLDEERKAQMISNLLVVLCSENNTQPVVNAGTIYG